MKKLEERFNQIILLEMGFSIIYGILGLIVFLKSEMTNNIAGILIGTFFLISGIIEIFTFIDKTKIKLFKSNLLVGIINILLGIFIMLNPLTIINILNIGFGIGLLLEGINKLILYIKLKKAGEDSHRIFLVSALLLIFMGIIIIINPFRSLVITQTIGIFVILYNIVNLNNLVLLKKRSKKFLKNFK